MTQRAALIAVVLFASGSAEEARAQDDPACAKYEDPLTYNACLASHGPKAGTFMRATPDEGGQSSRGQIPNLRLHAGFREKVPAGAPVAERRHGRVHMEFRIH